MPQPFGWTSVNTNSSLAALSRWAGDGKVWKRKEGGKEGALPLKEALKEIGKKDRRLIFIIITTNKLGIEGKGIIEENC